MINQPLYTSLLLVKVVKNYSLPDSEGFSFSHGTYDVFAFAINLNNSLIKYSTLLIIILSYCIWWSGFLIAMLVLCFYHPLPLGTYNLCSYFYPMILLLKSIIFPPGLEFFGVYLFIYFWESKHERGSGRERGRERIRNRLHALSV